MSWGESMRRFRLNEERRRTILGLRFRASRPSQRAPTKSATSAPSGAVVVDRMTAFGLRASCLIYAAGPVAEALALTPYHSMCLRHFRSRAGSRF